MAPTSLQISIYVEICGSGVHKAYPAGFYCVCVCVKVGGIHNLSVSNLIVNWTIIISVWTVVFVSMCCVCGKYRK